MELVNNCSYDVNTQRQISETGRESEIVEDAVTEVNVDVQENPAYNFRANVSANASVECENGEEYEVAVYDTNIPIEPNHAYNVHSTKQSDEVSEYELVIPVEPLVSVIAQQNPAYNIDITEPGDTVSSGSYEEISENATEGFYEEIPAQQNYLTQYPINEEATLSPLKAICSFWQGKVEVAVRITILVLAILLMVLYVASAGLAFLATNEFSNAPIITVIIGGVFPFQLAVVIIMEIIHLCIRIRRKRTTKCFLTWDILYCCMMSFFSMVFLGISAWLNVLWSGTSNQVEYVLFILITVLSFIFTALYNLRVCWIRATISMKWDSRMEI